MAMCVTCGCSDGSDVRITDPATGETITLGESGGPGAHEHTDASGRTYTHTHQPAVIATANSEDPGDRDRS